MHVFSNYTYCKTQYRELINKKADAELPSLTEEKLMTLHMQLQKIAFLLVQINYTLTNISKMTQIQMKRARFLFSGSFLTKSSRNESQDGRETKSTPDSTTRTS